MATSAQVLALPTPPSSSTGTATSDSADAAPPSDSADASPPPTSTWGGTIHSSSWSAPDAGARKTPTIHLDTSTVSAGIPPEVIQRIVRQSFGRLRLCYENGRRKDPTLTGRVVVRFVIDPNGDVAQANKTTGTTLPDPDVVRCVVRSFDTLSFPQPSAGSVDVVYPIDFAP